MKTCIGKLICLILILTLFFVNTASLSLSVNAEAGGSVYLGSYPQSKVADSSLLSAFEELTLTWQSYGYYEGDEADENHTVSDYMKYADFEYENEKYRAVTFSKYRDCFDTDVDETSFCYQDDNGYELNTVYYFKFEPVKWNILDESTGLALADFVLDSQPFSKTSYKDGYGVYYKDAELTYYSNNYAESTIRQWLNNDFYNTVFTEEEKSQIATTTCENIASDEANAKFNSTTTYDKVFFLSQSQVESSNLGFASDTDRMTMATDYAKVQGAFSTNSKYPGYAYWWTRSPNSHSQSATRVSFIGQVMGGSNITYTSTGVRPAITISNGNSEEKTQALSGSVTSFLSDTDEILITLTKSGGTQGTYTETVTVNSAEYLFENIEAGEYTLSVTKNNHVTRKYSVTVGEENVTQDLKIHPLGDINGDGKVNTLDTALSNAHAKTINIISDYAFLCGDINSDGKINTVDVARINAHAKGVTSIW